MVIPPFVGMFETRTTRPCGFSGLGFWCDIFELLCFSRLLMVLRVYRNKGTKRDIELCLVSDAHDCLPAGFEMACDG